MIGATSMPATNTASSFDAAVRAATIVSRMAMTCDYVCVARAIRLRGIGAHSIK